MWAPGPGAQVKGLSVHIMSARSQCSGGGILFLVLKCPPLSQESSPACLSLGQENLWGAVPWHVRCWDHPNENRIPHLGCYGLFHLSLGWQLFIARSSRLDHSVQKSQLPIQITKPWQEEEENDKNQAGQV